MVNFEQLFGKPEEIKPRIVKVVKQVRTNQARTPRTKEPSIQDLKWEWWR